MLHTRTAFERPSRFSTTMARCLPIFLTHSASSSSQSRPRSIEDEPSKGQWGDPEGHSHCLHRDDFTRIANSLASLPWPHTGRPSCSALLARLLSFRCSKKPQLESPRRSSSGRPLACHFASARRHRPSLHHTTITSDVSRPALALYA